ncbi:MAG TPA: hypothetical protein VGA13_03905 [Acidimicrobiales bacterium]|jgi:hypothetical protein
MRKLTSLAALAVLAPTAAIVATSGTAHAQCPENDGTIPGTGAKAYEAGPFYIDDRDVLDLDDDDDAGGLWIYMESNDVPDLQRGGDQIIFTMIADTGVDPEVPPVEPIQPVPDGPTLFPNGFGGGSLADEAGSHDDCDESVDGNNGYEADNIIF